MNRRKFIGIAGGAILASGGAAYLLSDRSNLSRADLRAAGAGNVAANPDELEILALASLAPSGHNTQPWFVQRLEPYHWIIGSDKTRWLPAVDPTQRETVLSIGAFLQNLEYAASSLGYACRWSLRANTNQDERLIEVKLAKGKNTPSFDTAKIRERRTVRTGFRSEVLRKEDVRALVVSESDSLWIQYLPSSGRESQYIDKQTLTANRLQSYRDPAQRELADWIRFSSRDAASHRDGLTTAGMEIEGIPGWVVRNFYGKDSVMKNDFREQNLRKIEEQVAQSAGWIVITSRDGSVARLLETGRRMQRLFLKVRERNIALHPMTQILEEPSTQGTLGESLGIREPIQFLLRTGYVTDYPPPVTLRRPVDWFLRS